MSRVDYSDQANWPFAWGTWVRRSIPVLDRGPGMVVGCTDTGEPIVTWFKDGSVTRHYLRIEVDGLVLHERPT